MTESEKQVMKHNTQGQQNTIIHQKHFLQIERRLAKIPNELS